MPEGHTFTIGWHRGGLPVMLDGQCVGIFRQFGYLPTVPAGQIFTIFSQFGQRPTVPVLHFGGSTITFVQLGKVPRMPSGHLRRTHWSPFHTRLPGQTQTLPRRTRPSVQSGVELPGLSRQSG